MDAKHKRRMGVAGAVAGLGAAGVGAAVGIRHLAVGRVRLRPDPDAAEPFGGLRGRLLAVTAADGVPLHVEVDGPDDAPLTVVFCHGYTLNQDVWHYQRRDLAAKTAGGDRLRMVFWDQRSHGRSGRGGSGSATIDQTGDDLYEVLRATVRPGAPVILAGHSMGGMSIMALAERHPELFEDAPDADAAPDADSAADSDAAPDAGAVCRVRGVMLVNTSGGDLAEMTLGLPSPLVKVVRPIAPSALRGLGRQAWMVDRARGLGADVAFVVTRHMAFADKRVSPTVVDFLEQMIRATPIDVIAEYYPALMAHDKAAALATLGRVPVLVLAGGRDRLTPAEHGRRIAEALPDAELVEVDEAGHVLPLEYPGVVTGSLRRLVDRVLPGPEEHGA